MNQKPKLEVTVTLNEDDLVVINELVQAAPFNKVYPLVFKMNQQIADQNNERQQAEAHQQAADEAQRQKERDAYQALLATAEAATAEPTPIKQE
jgi:hypothetical protein